MLQTVEHYTFEEYSRLTAKELLEKLQDRFNFPVDAPIDVDKIANLLGVKVVDYIDEDNLSVTGSVSLRDNFPLIWLNPIENQFPPRRRFTLAHELGHLLLHINLDSRYIKDVKQTLERKDTYWDFNEFEANRFAAQLLMPANLIVSYGKTILSDLRPKHSERQILRTVFIEKMAKTFEVSEPSMEYRLKNLGILSKT